MGVTVGVLLVAASLVGAATAGGAVASSRAPHSTSTGSSSSAAVTDPGAFVSLSPARVLDTRAGVGAAKARVASHAVVRLQVAGAGGVPAVGVAAVVLNVTVTDPTSSGYVTAYPDGVARPTASNLNLVKGQTIANLVVVKLGAGGRVDLYNGTGGSLDLVADVAGYYLAGTATDPGAFVSLSPARVLDTRAGVGAAKARVASHAVVRLQVAGAGGVPAVGVAAVVLNVTVTDPTSSGYVTAYPDGVARPTASNLNLVKGQTIANLVVVKLVLVAGLIFITGPGGRWTWSPMWPATTWPVPRLIRGRSCRCRRLGCWIPVPGSARRRRGWPRMPWCGCRWPVRVGSRRWGWLRWC